MDTNPADANSTTPAVTAADDAELFADLVDRSATLVELGPAQVETWVSGLLGTWRGGTDDVDPAVSDRAFLEYCRVRSGPVYALIVGAAAVLLDDIDAAEAPPIGLGTARPTSAWRLRDEGADDASVVIGFMHDDESEHTLVAEIASRQLTDVFMGPESEQMIPSLEAMEETGRVIEVESVDIDAAATAIAQAWLATVERETPVSDATIMNQLVALDRMRAVLGPEVDLGAFVGGAGTDYDFTAGMADEEVDEADRWAVDVLRTALAGVRGTPAPDGAHGSIAMAMVPIRGPIDHLDEGEQEALCFLEWADWLGVIIGMVRAGAGTTVTASVMVDFVNRCPEVSSTVPKQDREYVEYAFDRAIAEWRGTPVLDDEDRVTAVGVWALPRAAAQGWSGAFD